MLADGEAMAVAGPLDEHRAEVIHRLGVLAHLLERADVLQVQPHVMGDVLTVGNRLIQMLDGFWPFRVRAVVQVRLEEHPFGFVDGVLVLERIGDGEALAVIGDGLLEFLSAAANFSAREQQRSLPRRYGEATGQFPVAVIEAEICRDPIDRSGQQLVLRKQQAAQLIGGGAGQLLDPLVDFGGPHVHAHQRAFRSIPDALVREGRTAEHLRHRGASQTLARGQIDEIQLRAGHHGHAVTNAQQAVRAFQRPGLPQPRAVGDIETVQLI